MISSTLHHDDTKKIQSASSSVSISHQWESDLPFEKTWFRQNKICNTGKVYTWSWWIVGLVGREAACDASCRGVRFLHADWRQDFGPNLPKLCGSLGNQQGNQAKNCDRNVSKQDACLYWVVNKASCLSVWQKCLISSLRHFSQPRYVILSLWLSCGIINGGSLRLRGLGSYNNFGCQSCCSRNAASRYSCPQISESGSRLHDLKPAS